MIQLMMLALVGALLALTVKTARPEYGLLLSVAATGAILLVVLTMVRPVIDYLNELAASAGIDSSIFEPLLKAVGIALLTRITAELCRDAKEQGIAAAAEMCGAVFILFVSMPLFDAVLKLLRNLL